MLTVDDYGAIRRARRDGKSIRQIAHEFEHSRRTIRHVLKHGEPSPGPQTRNRTAPVLGPLHAIVDQILADDEKRLPSNATPPCRCFVVSKTKTATKAAMARSNATCCCADVAIKRPSFPWGIFQDNVSRPISATSTSTSPRAGGSCRSWSPPGLTPTRRLFCASLRADRGDPRRHGGRLRVLRLHPQGSLVGQSQDRRYLDPAGTPTTDSSPVRGAGQSLRLQSPLLHARPGQ